MTLHKVFDAAFPPQTAPPGAEGVLIYIGRDGFTPHVWTVPEADRFAHLAQFATWLPDLNLPPAVDAQAAAAAAKAMGWTPHMAEPRTRLILFDSEVSEVPAYYETWAAKLYQYGFFATDYGSESVVFGNAAYAVWAADWNGIPELQPGQTVHGDQYKAGIPWEGTHIDLSVIDDSLFARGGRGARRLIR